MIKRFYELLFDSDQATCFTVSPKGTRVLKVAPRTTFNYFSINALDPEKDRDPSESYHAADKPRRADHNVVCFRNILLEMDEGSFEDEEQMRLMQSTRVPWSTCVSSGGKSLHFILSLKEPLATRDEYSGLVRKLYRALETKIKIDPANKNPSRLSRCPEVFREEKNAMQSLVAVVDRVDLTAIDEWLKENLPAEREKPKGQLLLFPGPRRLSRFTEEFLTRGAPEGLWNNSLFRAACDLCACGHSINEATQMLESITGVLDASDMATIKSAFRRASRA